MTVYTDFVKTHRKAGKSMKEIGQMWQGLKKSQPRSARQQAKGGMLPDFQQRLQTLRNDLIDRESRIRSLEILDSRTPEQENQLRTFRATAHQLRNDLAAQGQPRPATPPPAVRIVRASRPHPPLPKNLYEADRERQIGIPIRPQLSAGETYPVYNDQTPPALQFDSNESAITHGRRSGVIQATRPLPTVDATHSGAISNLVRTRGAVHPQFMGKVNIGQGLKRKTKPKPKAKSKKK